MQEKDTTYERENERKKQNELELMTMIKDRELKTIESKLKPSAFMRCKSTCLVMCMKVCSYFCVPGLRQVCAHLLSPVKGLI